MEEERRKMIDVEQAIEIIQGEIKKEGIIEQSEICELVEVRGFRAVRH